MAYFSKISNPNQLRISLLEAAKEPLVLLSMQKDILAMREEKRKVILGLDAELNSLLGSIKKLDAILPEKDLKKELEERNSKIKESVPVKVSAKKTSETKAAERQMSEMDRLEYTLKKIESKLAELGK